MKPGRCKEYLEYISESPCYVCLKDAEAHHTDVGGIGLKGSDFSCIPLCREHHRELHGIGRYTFEDRHRILIDSAIKKHLISWCDRKFAVES